MGREKNKIVLSNYGKEYFKNVKEYYAFEKKLIVIGIIIIIILTIINIIRVLV